MRRPQPWTKPIHLGMEWEPVLVCGTGVGAERVADEWRMAQTWPVRVRTRFFPRGSGWVVEVRLNPRASKVK